MKIELQIERLYADNNDCVKHDISDIKLMLENISSQEKLERNQEETSYAETVKNRSSLGNITNMAINENNERQNATELSQDAEIGMTVIREGLSNSRFPIQRNDLSSIQSVIWRNPVQGKPHMEQSSMNFLQRNPKMEQSGRNSDMIT